jgi:hypothetical protein
MPKKSDKSPRNKFFSVKTLIYAGSAFFVVIFGAVFLGNVFPPEYNRTIAENFFPPPAPPKLDTALYDAKLLALANIRPKTVSPSSTAAVSVSSTPVSASSTPKLLWPVKAVYPNYGAILPFSRIVAYYGNFYSKGMGVLGEYPPDVMLEKLKAEVKNWEAADPSTPVMPAIDYIAVTAQGSKGADGKYRARMPYDQIDKAISLAGQVNGLVFLDIQVGLSNLQTEIPLLEKYLKMPQVELSVDPEFAMHGGARPGTVIGSLDAADINYAANYLAGLVKANNLPPKILIVHRFTQAMLTNYRQIAPLPEVQIVIDMDGWGFGAKKINTYNVVAYKEPVQFTGFKLFYKNDLKPPSKGMLTPAEVLKLAPMPSYIQYQ